MLRVSEEGNRRREGHIASYRQLRDSLRDLQDAADQIFDRVSERTAKESEKLRNLSNRIQSAKAKVDAISHSRGTISFRSPSRYPTNSNGEDDFPPLFGYKDGDNSKRFPVAKLLVNGGLNREYGMDGTLELFQFFSEIASDFPSINSHIEAENEATNSDVHASVMNLLKPNPCCSSFLEKDNDALSSSDASHQALPPPPPSLLHGSRVGSYSKIPK